MPGHVNRTRYAKAFLTLALTIATQVASAAAPDPQAIAEVRAGKRAVAHASWWGFQPEESTAALQAAIDSGAKKVVVEKMASPWIVDQLRLASDQELFFEAGAEVLAKQGAFHGAADSLFSAANKKNIKLIGPGATLRMRRADYDSADYTHAEWRHVLKFHGCTRITIEGLTLAESGGDGIYLGAGSGGAPCKDVVIRDVICDRNYRQGISVISAENLLIERCVLKDTAGTPPAAGIDFEPNLANERLVNCVMRDCTIENNQGYALHVYAPNLDGTSQPLSIRVENCVTRGTNARSASIVVSSGPKGPVKGLIELINCRFEDTGTTAITIASTTPRGVRLRMVDCTLADPAEQGVYPVDLGPAPAGPGGPAPPAGRAALVLDWGPLLDAVLEDLGGGTPRERLVAAAVSVADAVGEERVALTGGCFQNRLLTERLAAALERAGHQVLLHAQVPPNDGGVSLGQVVVAAARAAS